MNENKKIENLIHKEVNDHENRLYVTKLINEKPGIAYGVKVFVLNLALIFASIQLTNYWSPVKQFFIFLTVFVLTSFFIATRLRALSMLLHEAIHSNIAKSRKANVFFGRIVSLFLPFSYDRCLHTHTLHHKFIGESDKDPDFNYEIQKFLYNSKGSKKNTDYFIGLVKNYLAYLKYDLWDEMEPQMWRVLRFSFYLIFFLCLSYLFGYFLILLMATFVLYCSFPLIRFLGDTFDHGELVVSEAQLQTRNQIGFSKVIYMFLFPLNDQYHLVHHIYQNIPADQLGRAHESLMSISKTYCSFHKNDKKTDLSENDGFLRRSK
ncbi:MAG: fatty acid desaturase family protein [Bdellovibrio sp.]